VSLVVRAQRHRAVTGREGLIGTSGQALTDLGPEGWVRVFGERWHGVAEQPVASGERVTVVDVEGLTLKVRKEA
jgi:membrane-bound serine protease (ClpP class)